jgi:hypothetical protein
MGHRCKSPIRAAGGMGVVLSLSRGEVWIREVKIDWRGWWPAANPQMELNDDFIAGLPTISSFSCLLQGASQTFRTREFRQDSGPIYIVVNFVQMLLFLSAGN